MTLPCRNCGRKRGHHPACRYHAHAPFEPVIIRLSRPPSTKLTARQKQVLRYIVEHIKPVGPTVRDIAAAFGCQMNSIIGHLDRLEARGAIKRTGDKHARKIELPGPRCTHCGGTGVERITRHVAGLKPSRVGRRGG